MGEGEKKANRRKQHTKIAVKNTKVEAIWQIIRKDKEKDRGARAEDRRK